MSEGCSDCRGHRAGAARGVRHPAGNGSRWRGQAGVGKEERSLGGAQEARTSVVPRGKVSGTPSRRGAAAGWDGCPRVPGHVLGSRGLRVGQAVSSVSPQRASQLTVAAQSRDEKAV